MSSLEKDGNKIAAVLAIASAVPAATTVQAMTMDHHHQVNDEKAARELDGTARTIDHPIAQLNSPIALTTLETLDQRQAVQSEPEQKEPRLFEAFSALIDSQNEKQSRIIIPGQSEQVIVQEVSLPAESASHIEIVQDMHPANPQQAGSTSQVLLQSIQRQNESLLRQMFGSKRTTAPIEQPFLLEEMPAPSLKQPESLESEKIILVIDDVEQKIEQIRQDEQPLDQGEGLQAPSFEMPEPEPVPEQPQMPAEPQPEVPQSPDQDPNFDQQTEIFDPSMDPAEPEIPQESEPPLENGDYEAQNPQSPEELDDLEALNERIVESALGLVGITDGLSCTDVVTIALNNAGVDAIMDWPDTYFDYGYVVEDPVPGNLIYYDNGGRGVDHIAIYIGNDQAVHGNFTMPGDEQSHTIIYDVMYQPDLSPTYIQVEP